MKREQLKFYDCNEGTGEFINLVYDKPEADEVMDAMEARIKELEKALENAVAGGEIIKGLCERHEVRIKELEAEVKKWISVKDRLPEDGAWRKIRLTRRTDK